MEDPTTRNKRAFVPDYHSLPYHLHHPNSVPFSDPYLAHFASIYPHFHRTPGPILSGAGAINKVAVSADPVPVPGVQSVPAVPSVNPAVPTIDYHDDVHHYHHPALATPTVAATASVPLVSTLDDHFHLHHHHHNDHIHHDDDHHYHLYRHGTNNCLLGFIDCHVYSSVV